MIDLSADFRLRDPADYPSGTTTSTPSRTHSPTSSTASRSCTARRSGQPTSSPAPAAWRRPASSVSTRSSRPASSTPTSRRSIEAKTGSSGSGGAPGLGSHHPERSGAMRSFKPTGHRHSAEIIQELTVRRRRAARSPSRPPRSRRCAASSPPPTSSSRSRCPTRRSGRSTAPPTRTSRSCGSSRRAAASTATRNRRSSPARNWCDVGFERDPNSNRLVVMAALDNLMKGAAGQAVQAFNIRCGFPETTADSSSRGCTRSKVHGLMAMGCMGHGNADRALAHRPIARSPITRTGACSCSSSRSAAGRRSGRRRIANFAADLAELKLSRSWWSTAATPSSASLSTRARDAAADDHSTTRAASPATPTARRWTRC